MCVVVYVWMCVLVKYSHHQMSECVKCYNKKYKWNQLEKIVCPWNEYIYIYMLIVWIFDGCAI